MSDEMTKVRVGQSAPYHEDAELVLWDNVHFPDALSLLVGIGWSEAPLSKATIKVTLSRKAAGELRDRLDLFLSDGSGEEMPWQAGAGRE